MTSDDDVPLPNLVSHVKRKNFQSHISRACNEYLEGVNGRLSDEKLESIMDALNQALGIERFSQLQQFMAKPSQRTGGWQAR